MISKKYRLTETEVQKVLRARKPFFSHVLVANTLPNKLGYARIGIVLSGKQTKGSVNRNFFRRMIYDLSKGMLDRVSCDIVFIAKKGVFLDHKSPSSLSSIEKDILSLMRNIEKK